MENTARRLSLTRRNVPVVSLRFHGTLEVWVLLTVEYLPSES